MTLDYKKSIKAKTILLISLTALFFLIVAAIYSSYKKEQMVEQVIEERMETIKSLVRDRINNKMDIAITNAIGFSSNTIIIKGLRDKNRLEVIQQIKKILYAYKENTDHQRIKVHIQTTSGDSFVRSWNLSKYGDNLLSFRDGVKKVLNTGKSIVGQELGRTGLMIRGIVPVKYENRLVGSLEFLQGVESVGREFEKQEKAHFIELIDQKYINIAPGLTRNTKIDRYYSADDEWFSKEGIAFAKSINFSTLRKNGFTIDDKYFTTYMPVKDIHDKTVGIYLVGEPIKHLNARVEEVEGVSFSFLNLILFSFIVFAIIIGAGIQKFTLTPLEEFQKGLDSFFDFLQRKNSNIKKIKIDSKDEIGIMSQKVNENIEKIKKEVEQDSKAIEELVNSVKEIKSGKLSVRLAKNPNNPDFAEAIKILNSVLNFLEREIGNNIYEIKDLFTDFAKMEFGKTIKNPKGIVEKVANEVSVQTNNIINEVADTLQDLANGKLDAQITSEAQGDFATIKESINALGKKLHSVINEVDSAVIQMAQSSDQISSTAQSLSQGASMQAANLEETTASVEEMSASINQNAKNAKTTNEKANQGARMAEEGGRAVNKTVTAMESIAEKIVMVEDIAYQTNLLALNAAIEAARAGEHGKGFAVVAMEVRKLAERSQKAAGEISSEAKESLDVAKTAGDTIHSIIPNIKETATLINEIAAASIEQDSGIGQINSAMSQLDSITQQNAVSSEELAASSEEMSGQAAQLKEMMEYFHNEAKQEEIEEIKKLI